MLKEKIIFNGLDEILNFRFNYHLRSFCSDHENKKIELFNVLSKHKIKDHFFGLVLSPSMNQLNLKAFHINKSNEYDNFLCAPGRLSFLVSLFKRNRNFKNRKFNTLVVAGGDEWLSDVMYYLKQLRKNFKFFFFEAKDINCEWVKPIPTGLNISYVLRNGGAESLKIFNKSTEKTKLVAYAFGSAWSYLSDAINERSHLEAVASKSYFIDNIFCEPELFYRKLANYKFFISPVGAGIQTPKIYEALMCETVPIVSDILVHRELKEYYNLPLLIISDWRYLSKDLLDWEFENNYKYTDWAKVKNKLLIKNNLGKMLSKGKWT